MTGDATRRTGDGTSLERIREASDAVERSTTAVVVEKTRERWRTVGAIVVLATTTVLLFLVDGGVSYDTRIFATLTVLLLAYFFLTLRTDVRME